MARNTTMSLDSADKVIINDAFYYQISLWKHRLDPHSFTAIILLSGDGSYFSTSGNHPSRREENIAYSILLMMLISHRKYCREVILDFFIH